MLRSQVLALCSMFARFDVSEGLAQELLGEGRHARHHHYQNQEALLCVARYGRENWQDKPRMLCGAAAVATHV